MADLVRQICQWQRCHGRHHLPWQQSRDPYKVWLSEIMLQQTQVATVITYYERFLEAFPTILDLARAPASRVMNLWAGLGYYARARNLHKAAQIVAEQHGGIFPRRLEEILALPGIGLSTAHAIMAFCYESRVPIMDGNVKRLFCRYFGIDGPPAQRQTEKQLWDKAWEVLARNQDESPAVYTQGLMDLGALICKRRNPECARCPLQQSCYARQHGLADALPRRAPRKPKPQRSEIMLVAVLNNQVLLERRAASGIWGGLLCFPEFEAQTDLDVFCRQAGLDALPMQDLPPVRHLFTHFQLDIHPCVLALHNKRQAQRLTACLQARAAAQPASKRAAEDPEKARTLMGWHDLDAAQREAIPRPLHDILESLEQNRLF